MCGIAGFFKLDSKKEIDMAEMQNVLNYMLFQNQSRGKDSTGLGIVTDQNHYLDLRKTLSADKFMSTKKFRRIMAENFGRDTRAFFGHTRWATTGKVNKNNAQPFTIGDVMGTHNGVIGNWNELRKKHGFKFKTQCDSEILFQIANKFKDPNSIADNYLDLMGYFATAFYDKEKSDRITFARDYQELSVYLDADERFILWSSEEEVLTNLVFLFDLNLVELKFEQNQILEVFKNGKMCRYDLNYTYEHVNKEDTKLRNLTSGGYNPSQSCDNTSPATYPKDHDYLTEEEWKEMVEDKEARRKSFEGRNQLVHMTCNYCGDKRGCRFHDPSECMLCKKCRKRFRKYGFDMEPDKEEK